MTHFAKPLFCRLLLAASAWSLVGCETTDTGVKPGSGGTVTVQGTMFYPDQGNTTYIVPDGAQVIGAGGKNCQFIVRAGGSLTAHSGDGNTYRIQRGGHFRGFAHPARDCTVSYEAGAIIEKEESGPGTRFQEL